MAAEAVRQTARLAPALQSLRVRLVGSESPRVEADIWSARDDGGYVPKRMPLAHCDRVVGQAAKPPPLQPPPPLISFRPNRKPEADVIATQQRGFAPLREGLGSNSSRSAIWH